MKGIPAKRLDFSFFCFETNKNTENKVKNDEFDGPKRKYARWEWDSEY